jgi:hypothetical protein
MIRTIQSLLLLVSIVISGCSCGVQENKNTSMIKDSSYAPGTFGYDREFLLKHDSVIVLQSDIPDARVIVSPKYQAKVFTSTAGGDEGLSFGWVNYKEFKDSLDPHMNGYGGENRLWLGPEGGRFSLFFKPGATMEFANWKTPPAIDYESWHTTKQSPASVTMQKDMNIKNFKGTDLILSVDRTVTILSRTELENRIGLTPDSAIKMVGYETVNVLTNKGDKAWTEETGMPCIWMLDMMKPSDSTVIVVPFNGADGKPFNKIATGDYFGQIPDTRLKHNDAVLFLRADGKSRGKLGIASANAKPFAGSYDAEHQILTVIQFDIDTTAKYLNQEWNITKPSFRGDAVNAYNDGPLADGSQMGPFYEMESVSPAAFLKPAQSLKHQHAVFHFTGPESDLDKIALKMLGVSIQEIKKQF